MADIRCPMCGKPNPAGSEVCQFCQARLIPLRPPGSAQAAQRDEDLPDWLRALRPGGNEPAGGGNQAEEEELPDWLKPAIDESPVGSPTGGAADSLQSLRGELLSGQEPAAEEEQGDGEELFWDGSLGSQAESGESTPDAAGEEDIPDWLAQARGGWMGDADDVMQLDDAAQPEDASQQFDFSQWGDTSQAAEVFPAFNAELEPEPGEVSSEENIPDWLKNFHAVEAGEAAVTFDEGALVDEHSGEEPAGEGLFGDHVFNEGASATEGEELTFAPLAAENPGDEITGQADVFAMPPWLEEAVGGAEQGDNPDSFQKESAASQPEVPSIPEFFQAPAQSKAAEPLDTDLWKALQASTEEEETPAEEVQQSVPPAGASDTGLDFDAGLEGFDWEKSEQDLDWISTLGAGNTGESESSGIEETGTPAEFAFDDQALPEISDEEDTEDLGIIQGSDLPGWLAGIRSAGENIRLDEPAEEAAAELEPASPQEDDLTRSELPNWLRAMRPVETSAAVEAVHKNDDVEGAGPLAGLASVLPAEPDISQVGKPAAPVYKLQVPELQQTQAELFHQLISGEGQARPLRKRRELPSNGLLRILIVLALAAAALAPLFVDGLESSPLGNASGVQAAYQTVAALPAGVPVLMAVDYEPGWSGEMDAAAAGLVKHLLDKGVFLALASTSSTGPLQAEHLVALAAQDSTQGANVVNLGFIPGGAAGLQGLARTLRMIMPEAVGSDSPWSQPALQSVSSVSDFSLVVVVTESPDDAQAWIEQVQPWLRGTPLVMVVSAQAQPLVEPYYRGTPQQVQGLVTGLAGGVQYETLNGQVGMAGANWPGFSIALFTAVLFILLGGMVNVASAWLAARRSRGNEEG